MNWLKATLGSSGFCLAFNNTHYSFSNSLKRTRKKTNTFEHLNEKLLHTIQNCVHNVEIEIFLFVYFAWTVWIVDRIELVKIEQAKKIRKIAMKSIDIQKKCKLETMYCKLPIPVVLLSNIFHFAMLTNGYCCLCLFIRFFVSRNKFSRIVFFTFPQTVFHLKFNSKSSIIQFVFLTCPFFFSRLTGFYFFLEMFNPALFSPRFWFNIKRIVYFGLFSSYLTSNNHWF